MSLWCENPCDQFPFLPKEVQTIHLHHQILPLQEERLTLVAQLFPFLQVEQGMPSLEQEQVMASLVQVQEQEMEP